MNTVKTLQIESTNSDFTEQLGERLGRNLTGNEVIELVSDLGGGKTTLVHGIAKGIGSTDRVSSPTFTISKIYRGRNLELHHFDFYRLHTAGLIEHELHDIIGDPKIAIVVEWADVIQHALPKARLRIAITKTGEETRLLEISYPSKLSYIVGGL